ncbi:MAG: O-antigen ligase family protein [Bryobacterales bacterium]|nr:O-antigen ligase family protein [Bryobacteraceae bacterium]MDW8355425.1 O-antigen ligase family protein [Bryobacterales bacterium]
MFSHLAVVPEILLTRFHIKVHSAAATGLAALLLCLFHGHLTRFLKTPLALPWLLLFVWYGWASLFGLWPRVCLDFLWEYGLRFHAAPFFLCAAALSLRQVRLLLYWAGAGGVMVLLYCWRYGEFDGGRFDIPHTSLGNPNDLALHLLFTFSFLMLFLWTKSLPARAFVLLATPVALMYLLKTGSRGNFITLAAMVLTFLITARRSQRLAAVVLLLVTIPAVLPLVPRSTLDRLRTLMYLFSDEAPAGDSEVERAIQSQEARRQLQKHAIRLTLQHPLLGVGPHMFEPAVDLRVRAETGRKSTWQGPHNAYLQISSETGLPGLLFYLWTIVLCLRLNHRAMKWARAAGHRMGAGQSLSLLLATIAYAVGTLFSHLAYAYYLPFLVGLTAANHLAMQQELGGGRSRS